jgi:3-polyprenyl-4-hydroxybenzoate decarboxylase
LKLVIGITGSSGAVYAVDFLKQCHADTFLLVSKWGKVLLKDELNITEKELQPFIKRQFANDDLTAPLASGSNRFDAYVIIPCSTSTLGRIASGIGDTLITRTTLALEQCAKLSHDGAIIMPIAPPLYFVPKTVEEYVRGFTDKLLGVLGLRESRGWRAEELE